MTVRNGAREHLPTIVSIPQARLIELVAIFCIVYLAREIAGFTYRSGLVVSVFLVAAALNLAVSGAGGLMRRHSARARAGNTWSWITILVDLAMVLAVIYLTGTACSPFMFLVVVPLFFAGRLLPAMTAGFTVTFATLAAIATLGLLELRGVIPHFSSYPEGAAGPADPRQLMGALLVLGGFMGLMTYLFGTFYDNFQVHLREAQDHIVTSRRRIVELTRLYDISLGINSVISLDTLLKMVCKEITLLLRRPWAAVALVSRKQEVIKFVALGEDGWRVAPGGAQFAVDPFVLEVAGRQEGLALENAARDESASRSRILAENGIGPLLAVPINSGREVRGAILVGDRCGGPFSVEDARLLTILSGQVAGAIEKSRLYEVMTGRIRRLERENEGLQNANQLKMGYISHLSHELKTPLTSIKAYVESLRDHIEDPDFREKLDFLGVISSETDRLIRMVNKVLDISKIEFGQRTIRRKPFSLSAVIADVQTAMQPYLREKGLRLEVSLPAVLPLIDGDEDLVKQVFINLVGNAIKFTKAGSAILIAAREEAASLKVSVRDEGVGIPAEDLDNIFKQFYRVGQTGGEGVGLGLAIVKNIIEQHGGYIQVTSAVDAGSTFTFTLPKEHHFNDLLCSIIEAPDARDEIREMFQLCVRVVAEMLSAKIVSLMLLDGERKELFIKVAYGLEESIVESTRVPVGKSIAGRVAQTGEPLLIEDIEEANLTGAKNSPQYETKSLVSVPLVVGATVIGVINANNKTSGRPFSEDDLVLLVSVAQRISKVIERMRAAEDLPGFLRETVASLRHLLETCERDRYGFNRRLVDWSVKVARKLGLSDKEIRVVQFVSSVHDVGMTTISDEILGKTLALTPQEIDEIRKHPQRGTAIMRPFEFVEAVSQTMMFHHERVDGKGYPMGMKGEQIPVGSRIIAVLDAWVAMTSERPFRKVTSFEDSIDELVDNAGTQFDPEVVAAFMEVLVDEGRIDVENYAGIRERLRFGGRHHAMP